MFMDAGRLSKNLTVFKASTLNGKFWGRPPYIASYDLNPKP